MHCKVVSAKLVTNNAVSARLVSDNVVGVAQQVRAPDCGSGGRGFKSHHPPHSLLFARMAELVDALDLGSSTVRCVGSSPIPRTKILRLGQGELFSLPLTFAASAALSVQAAYCAKGWLGFAADGVLRALLRTCTVNMRASMHRALLFSSLEMPR